MKYSEYILFTEHSELDQATYKAFIKDGISANNTRLNAILDMFSSLIVPENYTGDVDEIYSEGLLEIKKGECAEDMLEYAPLLWAMPDTLSDAVYHVLEQLL